MCVVHLVEKQKENFAHKLTYSKHIPLRSLLIFMVVVFLLLLLFFHYPCGTRIGQLNIYELAYTYYIHSHAKEL